MNQNPHISRQYNEELEGIRNQVLLMGGLVEQSLERVLEALRTRNLALLQQVEQSDDAVDQLELDIDHQCIHILALRQPTASDLRLITSIGKAVSDLERVGDEIQRIASKLTGLVEAQDHDSLLSSLEHLGHHVQSMLHDALDAFARMDVEQAVAVAREDAQVDKEYESLLRQLMTFMMEDPRTIPRIIDLIWAARAMERIGDRARSVAQYLIYLVKGQDVRHQGPDALEAALR